MATPQEILTRIEAGDEVFEIVDKKVLKIDIQQLEEGIELGERALRDLKKQETELLNQLDDLNCRLMDKKYGVKVGTIIKYRGKIFRIDVINPRNYCGKFQGRERLKNGGWHKQLRSLYMFDPTRPSDKFNDYEILKDEEV